MGDLLNFLYHQKCLQRPFIGRKQLFFCNRQTPSNGYRLILPPQRPNMPRVPSIQAACGGKSPHSPLPAVVCAARARTHARWAPVRARAGFGGLGRARRPQSPKTLQVVA